ncbi:MAG: hypothetical protein RIC36_13320 [Rhodospirillales bacterium]
MKFARRPDVLIFAVLSLLLAGCSRQAGQNYSELIGDWQGHGAWELFRFWGQPEAVYRLPNGRRVAVFGDLESDGCVTEFEFDENGNVARASSEGGCRADLGKRIMLAAPDKPKVK